MKKPVIMWAAFEPNGGLILWTVKRTRLEAIGALLMGVGLGSTWELLRPIGYRVAKVEVREVEQ